MIAADTGDAGRSPWLNGLRAAEVAARRRGVRSGGVARGRGVWRKPASARGFGSAELEPTRDSTIQLYGESGLGVLEYTTGDARPVWWTLDLTTGAVQSYGTTHAADSDVGP